MGERDHYRHMLANDGALLESEFQQQIQFVLEMAQVGTPELLDEKKVKFLDEQGFPCAEVSEAFKSQKALLEKIFGTPDRGLSQDLLFHGTGLHKYKRDKYADEVEKTELDTTFENILDEGIKTHRDPWLPHGDTQTVSLANNYLYAKYFAVKHMSKDMEPEWQLGDPSDIFRYIMKDTIQAEMHPKRLVKNAIDHVSNRGERVKIQTERASKYENKLRSWTRSYRNDTSNKTSIKDLLDNNSDIADNFGIVLCIDKTKISYKKLPIGGAHEVRSAETILPENIKAIGAPLKELAKVKQMLMEHGRDEIEVFALECADLHFASFDIKDLVARFE
ncbi:MAG: hypothetical protein HYV41_02790 [Candidatus Magasanikbacteria bacterium]|nr:hypothetical protein [Candidatus Magasanikbacteria bacterium]